MMPKIKTELDADDEEWLGVAAHLKFGPDSPPTLLGGEAHLRFSPDSPTPGLEGANHPRPQERQLMRPWLWDRLEQGDVPGMFWVDKEKLQFRIPWKHGSRQGWEQQKDAVLFQMWAEHTGKFRRGDERSVRDPKTWKATFRCALNSLPDVKEAPSMSEKRGPNAYKVYQFLEPKKSRKIRKSTEGNATIKKTTRRINCYNREFAALPSPGVKRAYDYDDLYRSVSDDNDDGMSDTTDSGSEDLAFRPCKKVKTENNPEDRPLGGHTLPVMGDKHCTGGAPSFCTCASEYHYHDTAQNNKETRDISNNNNDSNNGAHSREKNMQILQMYLKSRDVRKALAQSLSEQRRLALLHQKFLATKQWVQTTQQTTTVTAFPSNQHYDEDAAAAPVTSTTADDVTSMTSHGNRTSIVSELAQKCLEERLGGISLPNVETLTRKNRAGGSTTLTIPVVSGLKADVQKETTPLLTPPSYSGNPTGNNTGTNDFNLDHMTPTRAIVNTQSALRLNSATQSTQPIITHQRMGGSPLHAQRSSSSSVSSGGYSPTVSPRAHPLASPTARQLFPAGDAPAFQPAPAHTHSHPPPTYHAVTAAKENQVLMTPPESISSNAPHKEGADRDTASPDSELSDESVISMVDDMMTMTTTTVKTTVTAAPLDFIPHSAVEPPSFCQLFSSSSQLLLANNYSQA